MTKKVYCKRCKYLYGDYSYMRIHEYLCIAPENETEGNWLMPFYPILPETKNENNDCEWFKEK